MISNNTKKPWIKKALLLALTLLLIAGITVYLIFTEKFVDTNNEKSAFTVNAAALINEFQANEAEANKKYREKIITVNGRVTETEPADTTVNIKIIDSLTGSYIIFAFQQQHLKEAKLLHDGDSVSIKGSCSGGTYSKILEAEFISFKRCAVNK